MDVATLNALLTLEYTLITAYDGFLSVLAAPAPHDPQAALGPKLIGMLSNFQSHHTDHAAALTALVIRAGGTPVPEVLFVAPANFDPTVVNAIKLLANTEKAIAVAHAQALKTVTAQSSAALLGAVGGVEAQHFLVLYLLVNGLLAATASTLSTGTRIAQSSYVVPTTPGSVGFSSIPDYTFP